MSELGDTPHEDAVADGGDANELDPGMFVNALRSEELIAWAKSNAFDLATVLLAARLAGGEYLDPRIRAEGAADFLQAAATAFLADQGRQGAPHRWLLRLYGGVPTSIRSRLVDEGDVRAADAVMAMHKEVAAGGSIDPKAWREARKRFGATVSPATPAAQAILASMWNPETSPGAIADVAESWITETSLADAIEQAGWSRSEYLAYAVVWEVFSNRRIPLEPDPDETAEAFEARQGRVLGEQPALSQQQLDMAALVYEARPPIALRRREELRRLFLEIIAD